MDVMDKTHDSKLKSWVDINADSDFPIQNIPFGIYCQNKGGDLRVVTAIGDYVLDLAVIYDAGFFDGTEIEGTEVFHEPTLNAFMSMGRKAWKDARKVISEILNEDNPKLRDNVELKKKALISIENVTMHLPVDIGDYTDFYSSREHASNVGTMFRGPDAALMPNWLHLPVGYHGRASSIVLSGTNIVRPRGQTKAINDNKPSFGDCNRLDFELEMGALIGKGNGLGEPISIDNAQEHLFGLTLVNDWSARDIQTWEYVPLGPFLAKNFATTISPWVITMEALEPFKCSSPEQNPTPFDYLRNKKDANYDINLEIYLKGQNMSDYHIISKTNYSYLYWNIAQQIAHHTITGCNLRTGDMLASGTISGPNKNSRGSMLELSWNGKEPIILPNDEKRTFLEDGDSIIFRGYSETKGYRIGFGKCEGTVFPYS